MFRENWKHPLLDNLRSNLASFHLKSNPALLLELPLLKYKHHLAFLKHLYRLRSPPMPLFTVLNPKLRHRRFSNGMLDLNQLSRLLSIHQSGRQPLLLRRNKRRLKTS
jgi:hypothetical protein